MKSSNIQSPGVREYSTSKINPPPPKGALARIVGRWRLRIGAAPVLGGWGLALSALAQYAIPWLTIDGGGGTRPVRCRSRGARDTAGAISRGRHRRRVFRHRRFLGVAHGGASHRCPTLTIVPPLPATPRSRGPRTRRASACRKPGFCRPPPGPIPPERQQQSHGCSCLRNRDVFPAVQTLKRN
jgi:hypothetical protein